MLLKFGVDCRPISANSRSTVFILASTRRLPGRIHVATVSKQRQARAVTVTLLGRFVVAQLGAILGIERFRTATRGFERQSIPIRKLAKVGIRARQPMRHG